MQILDGRFELEGILEETSWCNLHLGRDTELSRSVLVREFTKFHFANSPETLPFVRLSFQLAQLSHPNIEPIISFRRSDEGNTYILYETSKATSLRSLIANFSNIDLPQEFVAYLLGEIARTLAEVSQARDRQTGKPMRLVHQGLNPANIQLTEAGKVRLVNFALPTSGSLREVNEVAYLAPEQIQGGEVDSRVDLFSLCVIGYEMICGKRLFHQKTSADLMSVIVKGEYDLSEITGRTVDAGASGLIQSCLRLRKGERFSTPAEFAEQATRVVADRLKDPDKRITEYVEKFSEIPKLKRYSDQQRQMVRTRALTRGEIEEGKSEMSDRSSHEQEGNRRERSGQETRISNVPYSERIKRAKSGGFGGNKTVMFLSIIAGLLVIGIGIVLVKRVLSKRGTSQPAVTELRSGTLATVPDGASVYRADSLLGTTPLTFSSKEGEVVTIKHNCCPDTNVVVNFDQFTASPVYLQSVIEINSNPPGAKISVNGNALPDPTPHRFTRPATDTIQVTLELQGKPALNTGAIAVKDIGSRDIKDFEVAKLGGGGYQLTGTFAGTPLQQIAINSIPPGATVTNTATGEVLGQTPVKADIGAQSASIKVSKPGFEDWVFTIPEAGPGRKPPYKSYLFRRVDVTVSDEHDSKKPVSWRIKDLTYDGKVFTYTEPTPGALRLPGVDCRVVFAAEGYQDAELTIPATEKQAAVVMKPAGKKAAEEPPKAETKAGNKLEVKIIVIDNDKAPVAGATVTAERKDGDKATITLGVTDKEGVVKYLLEPAKYKFVATHPDYKDNDETEKVESGKPFVLPIKIKRK